MLDTFHARRKLPLMSGSPMPQKMLPEISYSVVSSIEVPSDGVNGTDGYGTGLKNEVGEYNCFLNVIIQVGIGEHFTVCCFTSPCLFIIVLKVTSFLLPENSFLLGFSPCGI